MYSLFRDSRRLRYMSRSAIEDKRYSTKARNGSLAAISLTRVDLILTTRSWAYSIFVLDRSGSGLGSNSFLIFCYLLEFALVDAFDSIDPISTDLIDNLTYALRDIATGKST